MNESCFDASDLYNELDEWVDDFWTWAKSQKQEYEWETDYEHWPRIYSVFSKLIETTEPSHWYRKTINNLLYLIARDHECTGLIHKVSEKPESLLFLAQEGLFYPDPDVRWQLAYCLTKISKSYPKAESIICTFCDDSDEYVRRRATLALGSIQSGYAEEKAIAAWKMNLEYQQIAALEVLKQIESKQLEHYVKLAANSEFKYVRSYAERIIEEVHKIANRKKD
ncbi:hypothetical protein B9G55_06610 [Saccharibacillus sp. O16]|nr:hypothetical protein B9G55_06610 [Saccharibacillus sp. O16]